MSRAKQMMVLGMVAMMVFAFAPSAFAKTYTKGVSTAKRVAAVNYAQKQLNDRYVWGAQGIKTWDCSGLVWIAYSKGAGVEITPDRSRAQDIYNACPKKFGTSTGKCSYGDLVFQKNKSGDIVHIGIVKMVTVRGATDYVTLPYVVHASGTYGKVVEQPMADFKKLCTTGKYKGYTVVGAGLNY